MTTNCVAATCKDRNSERFVSCHGFCGGCFHPKCVGLTGSLADKIQSKDTGIYWYCQGCRKFTMSALSSRLKDIEADLRKLGVKLAETASIHGALLETVDSLKDFNTIPSGQLDRTTDQPPLLSPPPTCPPRVTRSTKPPLSLPQIPQLISFSPLPSPQLTNNSGDPAPSPTSHPLLIR